MPLRSPPQYSTVQLVPYVDVIHTYCFYCRTKKYNILLINISKYVFLFVCLSVCISVCLSFCLPAFWHACLPIYLSEGSQSAGLSVSLSFFIYIGMFLPFCTTVWQSVCLRFSLPSCLLPPCLPSRQTDRQTLNYLQVLTVRQLFMQASMQASMQAGRWAGRQESRQDDRQEDRQAVRRAVRRADRQAER